MPPDDQHIIPPMEDDTPRLPMLRPQTPTAMPFDHMRQLAESIAKSQLFGIKTADQALVLMSIAQAEGRHPALAARDYHIINGSPSKKAEAMLRDFLSGGGRVEWHKLEDAVAEATFTHPIGGSVTVRWDTDRVRKAGLGSNGMYTKYPRQMLRSRVVSEGVRTVWPMATSGFYVPEEVADFAPVDQLEAPRPAGSKLEQFEQRHTVEHDAETGEVADPPPVNDAAWIAAGDAVCEKGLEEFRGWWNSLGKPLIARMGGQKGELFIRWKTRAIAADERGGPAPDDEYEASPSPQGGGPGADAIAGGSDPRSGSLSEPQESPQSSEAAPAATVAAPPPSRAPAASMGRRNQEIEPVIDKGKPDWRAWTVALFVPKLKQQQTADDLAGFIHDNALHMEAAAAALGVDWPDAAVTLQWTKVGR